MKNQPIWESSVRPLYIRSVWMEAQKGGVRGHRHFLLEERCNWKTKTKFKIEKSQTFDYDDGSNMSFELIGSAKQQTDSRIPSKPFIINRNLKSAPGYRTFEEYSTKGLSRTSSLQDIPSQLSTNSHLDEKLAERVLHWMDLAKMSAPDQIDSSNLPLCKKDKPSQQTRQLMNKRPATRKPRDPIKNVTIMFNKDIYSAKYNRIPRLNVQSCRKSSAGVSSAKLPQKPTEKVESKKKERPKSCVTFEDELIHINDSEWSKKEIHIFMPSLPKNVCGSNAFTEESLSTLCISDNKE